MAFAAFTATTANPSNTVATAGSFGRCVADEVQADNPLAYWRMNESSGTTMSSSTGAHGGSYLGGTAVGQSGALADPADRGTTFDGVNDTASVPDAAALRMTGNLTIEGWVRRTGTPGDFQRLIGKGSAAAANRNYGLFINANGHLLFQQTNASGTAVANLYSSRIVPANSWHHVAATVSGSTVTVYLDGVSVNTATRSGTPGTSTEPVVLGYAGIHEYFRGSMDEFAVYSSALSEQRIRAHFNAGRCYRDEPRADDASAQWRLGETTGSPLAFDSVGTNQGRLVGTGAKPAAPAAIYGDSDTAYSFNGSDDAIDLGDTFDFPGTAAFTAEAWVSRGDLSATPGFPRIFNSGSTATGGWILGFTNGTQRLVFGRYGSDGSLATTTAPSTFPTGWHHAVATYDGSVQRLYIDGVQVATNTTSQTVGSNPLPMVVGSGPVAATPTHRFTGSLDEAAVYGTALSAGRVRDHYIAGRSYRDVVMAASPVDYYRLGEASGTTSAPEVSGRNGVAFQGGYTRGVSGAIAGDGDSSVTFNGSTGYGAVGEQPSQRMAGNMTLETWVRPTAAPSDFARIVGKGASANRNYGIWIDSSRQVFFQQTNAGASQVRQAGFSAIPLSEWSHLAATVSGNTVTMFVNGQAVGSQTLALTPATAADNFSVAAAGYNSAFSGSVDDIALFDRALPADEIALHYGAGIRQPR